MKFLCKMFFHYKLIFFGFLYKNYLLNIFTIMLDKHLPMTFGMFITSSTVFVPHFWACSQNCRTWLLACPCLSVCLSVCTWSDSAPSRWIFMKFDILGYLKNPARKFKFDSNLARLNHTLQEDLCMFVIIWRWVLLRMRIVLEQRVEKIKTHYLCSVNLFQKSCHLWDLQKYGFQVGHRWQFNGTQKRCYLHVGSLNSDTRSDYWTLLLVHRNSGHAETPQCYVVCALPVLFANHSMS
jgi:hypothetical protein